jgi:hypothetical protein
MPGAAESLRSLAQTVMPTLPRDNPWRRACSPRSPGRRRLPRTSSLRAAFAWRMRDACRDLAIPLKTSPFLSAHRTHHACAGRATTSKPHIVDVIRRARAACRRCAAVSGVLTAKKTVIRFRLNNSWPQQRVSANPATTSSTTQSSARKVVMVDAGVVSLAIFKSATTSDPRRRAQRVFSCHANRFQRDGMLSSMSRTGPGMAGRCDPSRRARRVGG